MQGQAEAQKKSVEPDWSSYTNMPVGEILRKTRAYYGLSLNDVEKALRIRAIQLSALEDGRIEQLPGRVYAIGFVRAYSEFLGLDGDKMVHLFKSQLVGDRQRPEFSLPASASESKIPNVFVLLGSFAGLALMMGLYMISAGPKKQSSIPEVPVSLQVEMAKSELLYDFPRLQDLANIEPASGVQEMESRVVLNVIDNAWVEIRNKDGKAIVSRILKAGDSYHVPNEDGLVMDTGNVGVLEILVDGKVIDPLGEPGDVRRNLSLDPISLLPEHGPLMPVSETSSME